MNVPKNYRYSEDHEWAKAEGNRVTVGLTDFAQNELGEIVFVELPEPGTVLEAGQPYGSVESVKTVSELYAPLGGKVVAVNTSLLDAPEKVNASPYEDGWMIVVETDDSTEFEQLWTADKYISTYGGE